MPSSTTIPRGNIQMRAIVQLSLTPPNVGANTSAESTYTLSGVIVGDYIEINKPTHTTGLSIGNVRVSAKDTIAVQFVNSTGLAINNTPAENYLIVVSRFDGAPASPPSAI